ncbi:MAG: 2-amino-4-hydroxy-6-hydroxymethyldihydropteridine diphosphokinase [Luminiphilus sp.]|jgi:2-amino-4-hydroxy-6-hydroxymethyldihydropteridine diphosphokinase|nr:2-amino-4-hydroxy-6-hydroxymethyldihydropteridine diphosphokinase [Luminiphilus sp.]
MSQAFVAMGSNMNDPMQQLSVAYGSLVRYACITPTAASHVYLSSPMGPQDQPDFYNAVVAVRTSLEPQQLLETLLLTERSMGRQRTRHWGERCIDLDLLFYDDRQINTDSLVLPHPRAHQRLFVLDPLIELLGERYIFQGKGLLQSLRAQCTGQTIRVLCDFPA